MKKIIVLIILLIGLSVQAVVIKGGVHYTVESAREEAFSKVRYTISLDKNGKPKIRKFGRFVTFFSDGEYGVFSVITGFAYYYDKNGKLYALMKNTSSNYPVLIPKYDIKGQLIEVMYRVEKNNTYVYGADKTYKGHWLGNNFYNPSGVLEYKRASKYFNY